MCTKSMSKIMSQIKSYNVNTNIEDREDKYIDMLHKINLKKILNSSFYIQLVKLQTNILPNKGHLAKDKHTT
jgi:hypothetical protein